MDEYIDIVNSKGEFLGITALKSEAHKNGWYHNTIHVWFFTQDGKVLLQQRSHKKKIYPLLWDVSVAGHIDAGESFETAAIRETKEEIGLEISPIDLIKIGVKLHESVYANGSIKDFEFHQVYIAKLKVNLNDLVPQEDEVEALKLVEFDEFTTLLTQSKTNNHFIESNSDYYHFVIKAIKENLKE